MLLKNRVIKSLLLFYHFLWALGAAIFYGFPSRRLTVIGVTGTKGKTTVTEMLAKILEASGVKIAVANGLRFKIGEREEPNLLKMTMPGKGKLQKFLHDAVRVGCKYAVIEVTSEGIKQHRHRFIKFDVVAITNLEPEHIEAHGSFEAYRSAKGRLFSATHQIHVINAEDAHADYYKQFPARRKILCSLKDVERLGLKLKIPGEFNLMNAILAAAIAEALGVSREMIQQALLDFTGVPGRMQFIQKEPFAVIVDYAHTPNSLEAVYGTARRALGAKRLICVLGAAGGGRDKWKRPIMGGVAAKYCDEIILTDEDPYDERPEDIIEEIMEGISINPRFHQHESAIHKILDRKKAIKKAISLAKAGDVVIITGKGAERFMAVGNKKIPWSDAEIVREILDTRFEILDSEH